MFRDRHQIPKCHADPVDRGDKLHDTTAVLAVREWTFSRAALVILAGSVGTGKSLAAAWALWDRLTMETPRNQWGDKVPHDGRLWIAAPHLCRLASWSDDVQECYRAPWLVIDDMGEEEATPKAVAALSEMITTRTADGLRTIITTNLDQKTFRDRYGERIIDRLKQSGLNEHGKVKWWVRCIGESLRGKVEPAQQQEIEHDDIHPDEPEAPVDPAVAIALVRELQDRMKTKEGA